VRTPDVSETKFGAVEEDKAGGGESEPEGEYYIWKVAQSYRLKL